MMDCMVDYSTGTTVKHVLFRYNDYIIYIYSNGIESNCGLIARVYV
jgi:hypothetical protein